MATYYALASATGTGNAGTQIDPWSPADFHTWYNGSPATGSICELKDDGSGFPMTYTYTAGNGSATGQIQIIGVSDWGTPLTPGNYSVIDNGTYELNMGTYHRWENIEVSGGGSTGYDECANMNLYCIAMNCRFEGNSLSQVVSIADYCTCINCQFYNAGNGGTIWAQDYCHFRNCYFHLTYNHISYGVMRCTTNCNFSHCIFDHGYEVQPSYDCCFWNCVFYEGYYHGVDPQATNHFLGCIFMGATQRAIDSTKDCFVDYCHFYNNGSNFSTDTPVQGTHNALTGANPLFVDPNNANWRLRDFSLQASSPCRDAGFPVQSGVGSAGSWHIGAYQETNNQGAWQGEPAEVITPDDGTGAIFIT